MVRAQFCSHSPRFIACIVGTAQCCQWEEQIPHTGIVCGGRAYSQAVFDERIGSLRPWPLSSYLGYVYTPAKLRRTTTSFALRRAVTASHCTVHAGSWRTLTLGLGLTLTEFSFGKPFACIVFFRR
jgi:hypothetical protein